ncbi:Putative glycosyltransferase EpsE [Aquisphaera giovannonii]|uniref:Glycosyltransferase EpsE n=1 Tax=Aquisphaera giovannonii TaxID=406548 RepID=A0A5B9W9D4_9BACT|nr:glycosyltransferase family A protein [Aquisphaera giovannonii]QEH37047.1 Putative glycosyltransferase EpsE [Aquisphaera giovannonii]
MSAPGPVSFTVAVPSCNGVPHIEEALRSILNQQGAAFDIVLSDDHSDDDTVERVRALAGERVRICVNAERLGLAGNWNRCVELCETPLIAIVHQDDVLGHGHVAAHVAAFDRDDRIGLVASASTIIDECGREVPPDVVERGGLGVEGRLFGPGEALSSLACGNPLRCSAVSIRVAAFRDVGGFDPSFRYALDWDFWVRVARAWKLAWLAEPTVRVRWHRASETHRFKPGRADLDEARRMMEHVLELLADPSPLRPRCRARISRAFLNRAHDALRGGRIALARECLAEAFRLSPRILGAILADPRLAAQMTSLAVAPPLARRWFSRRPATTPETPKK